MLDFWNISTPTKIIVKKKSLKKNTFSLSLQPPFSKRQTEGERADFYIESQLASWGQSPTHLYLFEPQGATVKIYTYWGDKEKLST